MTSPSRPAICRRPIPGGWTERDVFCAGRSWNLCLPADADEFLEQLAATGDSHSPEPEVYWARLWPTASQLAALIPHAPWPAGSHILELGCGIGLVGLATLAAGWDVTFSDQVELAVELALTNAQRHDFHSARGLVFDWKTPPSRRFDGMVASDILYDVKQHAALVQLLEEMLEPAGFAWIADPGRFHVPAFMELAWERRFDVELRDESGQAVTRFVPGAFHLLELRRWPLTG